MKMIAKKKVSIAALVGLLALTSGCAPKENSSVTLLIAAAASMQPSLQEINKRFEATYENVTVEGTYDSSGKLQTQIEAGLEADVFLSAAMTQMNVLVEESLVEGDSVTPLLENEVVLIVPKFTSTDITSFEDITTATQIAIGDPASVPAGQYAKEIFEALGRYEEVASKASFATNVTEVLHWVAEGSADAGVVYATDAATTDEVVVVAKAPEGTLEHPVIYPIGIVSTSKQKDIAQQYLEFLQSEEAKEIFETYGFLPK